MDRISRIGVVACLALLLFIFWHGMPTKLPSTTQPPAPVSVAATAPAAVINPAPAPAAKAAPAVPEQIDVLENDDIAVTFTSHGAAIKTVELKKQKAGSGNVILNEKSQSNVLQLSGWPGADEIGFQVAKAPGSLTYTGLLPNGLKWVRTYTLDKEYGLGVTDVLNNSGTADVTLPPYSLSVGRAQPLLVQGHYQTISNLYLGSGWLTTKAFHLTTVNDFNPGFIPIVGIKTHESKDVFSSATIDSNPIRWIGAENQFFTILLTPAADHLIDHAVFQCFNTREANGQIPYADQPDIEASAFFPTALVPAGKSLTYTYSLYAGPKEYDRLSALGEQQGELMHYNGFLPFAYLIVPMLWVLHFFHSIVGNYGVAIILLTLCIKMITWPLQSVANRSGKRMQALAPKLKELQAKYKEQPEKLNTETFALYREFGVNPFGGCLPALVQMPVFFSLYYMLQNAVELRHEKFLWVHDLTQPDTIATFMLLGHHLALNPLPLMVTGLTVVMMRLTPQIGDPQQAKIAQFMPLVFLFIFYNFAAALSLYYVINNCVSIFQIKRNLSKPLPDLKRAPKKKTA